MDKKCVANVQFRSRNNNINIIENYDGAAVPICVLFSIIMQHSNCHGNNSIIFVQLKFISLATSLHCERETNKKKWVRYRRLMIQTA